MTTVGEKICREALDNAAAGGEINLSDADVYGHSWNFNDRKYASWKNKAVNASTCPAARWRFFSGLIDMTKGNDDWLATVLGHEIAHALAHHASERVARQKMDGQAVGGRAGSAASPCSTGTISSS